MLGGLETEGTEFDMVPVETEQEEVDVEVANEVLLDRGRKVQTQFEVERGIEGDVKVAGQEPKNFRRTSPHVTC